MDYGKIAYLKTEDIERRLNAITSSNKSGCESCTVNPELDLRQGVYEVTEVSAEGTVTILLKATLRANADVSERLCLLVNGLVAGTSDVNCKAGAYEYPPFTRHFPRNTLHRMKHMTTYQSPFGGDICLECVLRNHAFYVPISFSICRISITELRSDAMFFFIDTVFDRQLTDQLFTKSIFKKLHRRFYRTYKIVRAV